MNTELRLYFANYTMIDYRDSLLGYCNKYREIYIYVCTNIHDTYGFVMVHGLEFDL